MSTVPDAFYVEKNNVGYCDRRRNTLSFASAEFVGVVISIVRIYSSHNTTHIVTLTRVERGKLEGFPIVASRIEELLSSEYYATPECGLNFSNRSPRYVLDRWDV